MATLSQNEWKRYISRLRAINDKAANEFRAFVVKRGGYAHIRRQALIDYAYAISTKYGEASAALSAAMYDAAAELAGAVVPAAVPAETVSYSEVAKTVNGIIKKTGSDAVLSQNIGRLVKLPGVDTMLSNAYRDSKRSRKQRHTGAEVAWIPSGDTCPYCIMLASAGWRKETNWGEAHHAEHVHANCDCTYMVRFNDSFNVEGYDPDEYLAMYEEGADVPYENEDNSHPDDRTLRKQRLNGMRREAYQENKEKINEQKRSAYEKRKELESSKAEEINVG